MNFRSKRVVMSALVVFAVLLFSGGILAGYLSRRDKICPNGKPPIAQRSEVIGSTEYKCSDGVIVTK